jgi:hypothetical protein
MEPEIAFLAAHQLAFRSILAALCRRLAGVSPDISSAILEALDEAARKVEDAAIILGERVPPEYSVEAMRIVEDTRVAVFGSES